MPVCCTETPLMSQVGFSHTHAFGSLRTFMSSQTSKGLLPKWLRHIASVSRGIGAVTASHRCQVVCSNFKLYSSTPELGAPTAVTPMEVDLHWSVGQHPMAFRSALTFLVYSLMWRSWCRRSDCDVQ